MDPPTYSRSELQEMVMTRYVNNPEDEIETVRAGSSIMPPSEPDEIVALGHDDVVLTDDQTYRPIHGIDDTPKIVPIKKKLVRENVRVRDEAVKVLLKLESTSPATLRPERYDYYSQRWFNTTRESELQLFEHVVLHPNARPSYFSMQCRHLKVEDIADIVLTALMAPPHEKGQSLARFAVKTTVEMAFGKLIEILEWMVKEHAGFKLHDAVVVATLIEPKGNRNKTHRMKTNDYKAYAQLEPNLDQEGQLMSSRASITCSIIGKRHVQVQITYFNNGTSRNDMAIRNRFIEVEQTVKCTNRRVLIAEDRNESHEYEIEGTMISLKNGVPPVVDLIEYLKCGDMEDDEESAS